MENKPILKWIGGKRRFSKKILISAKVNVDSYNRYIEPFAGSAAIFFEFWSNSKKESILNDLNEDLINFYKNLKEEPSKLFDGINKKINFINNLSNFDEIKTEYYTIREKYNNDENELDHIEKAILFFVINKMAFNGIYRVNANGKFNVPIGSLKDGKVPIPLKTEFDLISSKIKNTKFYSKDANDIIKKGGRGDLIYLDPPYFVDESSKFIGYTDPMFDSDSHKKMLISSVKAFEKGADIIISNSLSKEFKKMVEEAFSNYKENLKIYDIQTNKSINPKSISKERFYEKLYVIKH